MKIYNDLIQGSEEWLRIRTGKPTASNFDKIITPTGQLSKQRADYARELVASCIIPNVENRGAGEINAKMLAKLITPTGKDSSAWEEVADTLIAEIIRPDQSASFEGNADTDRGNDLEDPARQLFTSLTQLEVNQVGFITRDDGIVGCSPDGLIYSGGIPIEGVEIKAPRAKHHASYILHGGAPQKYLPQVHGSMAVTELNAWWFMSYCEGMRSIPVRVERSAYTDVVEKSLDSFLLEYRETWAELKETLVSARSRFLDYFEGRRKQVIPILTGREAA